jgi:succinate dehydrogenase hydrophobic anchor subunit
MNRNDKEDETAIIVATAVVAILYTTVPEKEKDVASVFDQHLCWNQFTETHGHCHIFTCHVHMMLTSFTKLLGYIHDSLLDDRDMASLCSGVIALEIQLYCTLHSNFSWLFPLPII